MLAESICSLEITVLTLNEILNNIMLTRSTAGLVNIFEYLGRDMKWGYFRASFVLAKETKLKTLIISYDSKMRGRWCEKVVLAVKEWKVKVSDVALFFFFCIFKCYS